MSRKDAHAFAASLAATLMVSIVVFQAGDGTFGAVPADEIDGDEVRGHRTGCDVDRRHLGSCGAAGVHGREAGGLGIERRDVDGDGGRLWGQRERPDRVERSRGAGGERAGPAADAVARAAKGIAAVAEDPIGARVIAAKINRVRFARGPAADLVLSRGVFLVIYQPSAGLAGRSSSSAIIKFLEESL